MADHGGDTRRVFNLEFLEICKFVSQIRIFVCQTHLGTPTDQQTRACARQGKPIPGVNVFFEISIFANGAHDTNASKRVKRVE